MIHPIIINYYGKTTGDNIVAKARRYIKFLMELNDDIPSRDDYPGDDPDEDKFFRL